jgi:hypothetical protein
MVKKCTRPLRCSLSSCGVGVVHVWEAASSLWVSMAVRSSIRRHGFVFSVSAARVHGFVLLQRWIGFVGQNGHEPYWWRWSLWMSPVRLSLFLRTRKARLEYTTRATWFHGENWWVLRLRAPSDQASKEGSAGAFQGLMTCVPLAKGW